MLRLIPAPLHRVFYRLAHRGRTGWLGLRGGTVHGASVIGRDAAGRVLLVRHAYGLRTWSFPGGGIRRGEDPALTAQREFAEELGCALDRTELLGVIDEPFHGAVNRVHLFTGIVVGDPRPDGRELTHAEFFALDGLPGDLSRTVAWRLELLEQR